MISRKNLLDMKKRINCFIVATGKVNDTAMLDLKLLQHHLKLLVTHIRPVSLHDFSTTFAAILVVALVFMIAP